MTPYLSIDIETTGLDPEYCQILEIGAVWETWNKPIDELPCYRAAIKHQKYVGDAYALWLNHRLLKEINDKGGLFPSDISYSFYNWLHESCDWDRKSSITPAGKNFNSFDRQFLNKIINFESEIKLSHRAIDPAMLYWNPKIDIKLPNLSECYKRAGLNPEVAHTAIDDAKGIIKLIRKYYGIKY
ncbi:MAG: hypothetical protein ACFFG0_15315 [Candidatus Thorarchaeota archaeon]